MRPVLISPFGSRRGVTGGVLSGSLLSDTLLQVRVDVSRLVMGRAHGHLGYQMHLDPAFHSQFMQTCLKCCQCLTLLPIDPNQRFLMQLVAS